MTDNLFYINSFPRSGNTWVRSILNLIIAPEMIDANPVSIKLFGILPYMKTPEIGNNLIDNTKLTMIKSHGKYDTTIKNTRIIYLVRDGRDALLSYYHFNVDHRGYTESFDKYFERHVITNRMINHREHVLKRFIGDWSENVLSYINKSGVLVVKYEDLLQNSEELFNTILNFIGLNVDNNRIKWALDIGRLQLEGKNACHDRPRGASGNWKDKLSIEQQNAFYDRHKYVLNMFGYDSEKS